MTTKKDKFHALLAVEGEVKAQCEASIREATTLFKTKHDHFIGQRRTYTPLFEDGTQYDPESKEITTNVIDKLVFTQRPIGRAIDLALQKECANTNAKADLIVDGKTLGKDIPATALLNLEGRLKVIRQMYQAIPTLQPGIDWRQQSDGTHKTENTKTRTEKQLDVKVLYPATDRHPAQVEKINKDIPVGIWKTETTCGMLNSGYKSHLLERIDNLINATKSARMTANDIEYNKVSIADNIFNYINGSV